VFAMCAKRVSHRRMNALMANRVFKLAKAYTEIGVQDIPSALSGRGTQAREPWACVSRCVCHAHFLCIETIHKKWTARTSESLADQFPNKQKYRETRATAATWQANE